jgi:hypothetical protein
MGRHEVDGFRRNHFRRNAQVAFILSIIIVYDDDHATCFEVGNCIFDARELKPFLLCEAPFFGALYDLVDGEAVVIV